MFNEFKNSFINIFFMRSPDLDDTIDKTWKLTYNILLVIFIVLIILIVLALAWTLYDIAKNKDDMEKRKRALIHTGFVVLALVVVIILASIILPILHNKFT